MINSIPSLNPGNQVLNNNQDQLKVNRAYSFKAQDDSFEYSEIPNEQYGYENSGHSDSYLPEDNFNTNNESKINLKPSLLGAISSAILATLTVGGILIAKGKKPFKLNNIEKYTPPIQKSQNIFKKPEPFKLPVNIKCEKNVKKFGKKIVDNQDALIEASKLSKTSQNILKTIKNDKNDNDLSNYKLYFTKNSAYLLNSQNCCINTDICLPLNITEKGEVKLNQLNSSFPEALSIRRAGMTKEPKSVEVEFTSPNQAKITHKYSWNKKHTFNVPVSFNNDENKFVMGNIEEEKVKSKWFNHEVYFVDDYEN